MNNHCLPLPGGAYRVIDRVGMPQVLAFINHKLADYDTAAIEWVKLLPLNRQAILHGCCTYPLRGDAGLVSGYRLRASVNVVAPPPYAFEHWGRIPSNNKQGWYSGAVTFHFEDLEQCALHTLAHECFHFLSHSRQVRYKNTEANANWWADRWLAEYRP